jgi:hypothetical protein
LTSTLAFPTVTVDEQACCPSFGAEKAAQHAVIISSVKSALFAIAHLLSQA